MYKTLHTDVFYNKCKCSYDNVSETESAKLQMWACFPFGEINLCCTVSLYEYHLIRNYAERLGRILSP